ncbi:HEAT repeat domain-containing protein [Anatilimnocola sp. NA78]|uniref:HEAT repeat domain-containing protein n=1 Tax=Anatilimnocola sp. NA78 TaxID=3415683 RepID=UPI003CE51720
MPLIIFSLSEMTDQLEDRLSALLEDLRRGNDLAAQDLNRAHRRANWLTESPREEWTPFFAEVIKLELPLPTNTDRLLTSILASMVQQRRTALSSGEKRDSLLADPQLLSVMHQLYVQLPQRSGAKAPILTWLAAGGTQEQLELLVNLLLEDPPEDEQQVALALSPLFLKRPLAIDALFPKLFAVIDKPQLAAAVLDLANYLVREKLVEEHPGKAMAGPLMELLSSLTHSLGSLEERPEDFAETPQQLARRVAHSVSLAVSLCDALALIGDERAIGKLNQALALAHRRVRTEAAAALARLGDQHGKDTLVELAAEPVARLRVLTYATELKVTDKIPPQYRTPAARAESELVIWLAEPTQFGVPPTQIELVDQRKQHWPGYNGPVDCFLFRFTYRLTLEDGQQRSYSNVGIAGPLAHAFTADLADLPPDDIYAAFAGWQAEHEDIKQYEVPRLSKAEQLEVVRLQRRLHDAGYAEIQPLQMGYFFGEKALLAEVQRDGAAGVAVADFEDILFYPVRQPRRSLGIEEAYSIYKGRKLLRTFNPPAPPGNTPKV